MRHCRSLAFTCADAEALLHSCPRLRTVRLDRSAAGGGEAAAALAAAHERRRRSDYIPVHE